MQIRNFFFNNFRKILEQRFELAKTIPSLDRSGDVESQKRETWRGRRVTKG